MKIRPRRTAGTTHGLRCGLAIDSSVRIKMTEDLPRSKMTYHDTPLHRGAFSATVHCLTGCAIGEVLGMVISTAANFSNAASIIISIILAFVFGYGLTSLPLLRSGLPLRRSHRWPWPR